MSGMPLPEWASSMKEVMDQSIASTPSVVGAKPFTLTPVTNFSTHFAEYMTRENDLLVHFFPRDGEKDTWEDGRYINRCRNCRAEVPEGRVGGQRACDRCGHVGLLYLPGRREQASEIKFPEGMHDLLKAAADKVWMGDVAIESVEELGAWVIQFQNAKQTANVVGPGKFVDKLCEEVDRLLD